MLELDAAVDEYLHAIVRAHPWTVKRETAILEGFSDWLYAQPELSVELERITPVVVQRYATESGLSNRDRDAVAATIDHLRGWVDTRGLMELRRAVKGATR